MGSVAIYSYFMLLHLCLECKVQSRRGFLSISAMPFLVPSSTHTGRVRGRYLWSERMNAVKQAENPGLQIPGLTDIQEGWLAAQEVERE